MWMMGILSLALMWTMAFYSVSQTVRQVDYALNSLSPAILEGSIDTFGTLENESAYFDQTLLEEKITLYLELEFKHNPRSYSVSFHYFKVKTLAMCSYQCDGVTVRLTAVLLFETALTRTRSYTVQENR